MKVKFGYRTCDNSQAFVSDITDWRTVVAKVMKDREYKSYECDYEAFQADDGPYVTVFYKTTKCTWTCQLKIFRDTLLEIDGELYNLSNWAYNDRYEKL